MNSGCLFVFLVGICLAEKTPITSNPEPPAPKVPIAEASVPIAHDETVHPTVGNTNITTSSKQIVSTSNSSSATLAPIITTTKAPVPPTPAPTYGVGEWNVTDANGTVCILLAGDLSLVWKNETNNKVISTLRVPSNAPNHGNCEEQCIEFELPNNSSLHLMFSKNTTEDKFYLKALKGIVNFEVANKTVNEKIFNDTLHLFENPLEKSYYCNPATDEIVYKKPLEHFSFKVESFQVQAFKNSTKTGFDDPINCEASHTPDIVPILVGCALALLVILVLIAYLISRRQQSRGYLSM